jgi:hypothetical protein
MFSFSEEIYFRIISLLVHDSMAYSRTHPQNNCLSENGGTIKGLLTSFLNKANPPIILSLSIIK